jgi:hypothetical protein
MFQGRSQIRHLPVVAQVHVLVIGFLGKDEWHNALTEQVATVDPREALGDNGSHPEEFRSERRVLATGALAVIVAGHYEPAMPFPGAGRELTVDASECEVRHCGHVRAERHHYHSIRRQIAGRDVVADHVLYAPGERLREWRLGRWRLHIRPVLNLDISCRFSLRWKDEVTIVDMDIRRWCGRQPWLLSELARVGDRAAKRGRGSRGGTAQVDQVVVRT